MAAELTLTDLEYKRFRDLLYAKAGISLGDNKKPLLTGRLHRRVTNLGLPTYSAYLIHIQHKNNEAELRHAIDLLTTNETYFWRESVHFDQLNKLARAAAARSAASEFRVWSAASSSGEEIYTIAMILQAINDSGVRLDWKVLGTDISTRMIERAQRALYPEERAQQLPLDLKKRYCLKGTGEQAGTMLISRALRDKVSFHELNLIEPLPHMGPFDVIFLRNVMIYFDLPTKAKVVHALTRVLKPNGVLFIGLAETLNGIYDGVVSVAPGMYRLPERA